MRNKTVARLLQAAFAAVMATTILFGVLAAPQAQASSYKSSGITLRDDVTHDYTQYLDSSKMYPLPESVQDDQQIAVIVTVNAPNLMDAYEAADTKQNFAEFAQTTDKAAEIISTIGQEKTRILSILDEQQIS